MQKNYYKILQVDILSTSNDIKEAYKKLALRYHPDKSGKKATEETFKQISEAYQVLVDENQRRQYNQKFLSSICYTEQFIQDPPVYHEVQITLKDIFSGCKKSFNLPKKIRQPDGSFRQVIKEFTLDIKRGMKGGTKFTFPREGDEKPNHIPADIVFVLVEKTHPCFVRKGNDLHFHKKISFHDLLAKEFGAQTVLLDGSRIQIKMNSCIQRHQKYVAREKGLPSTATGTCGDFIIHFEVGLPSDIQSITFKADSFPSPFFI